jgi:CRISPR-associated endonuclease/helicase Cas3
MNDAINQLDLPALDGANPLGFLAAIGTLAVLTETNPRIKLSWHAGARWTPFLTSPNPLEEAEIVKRLATRLRGTQVDDKKEKLRDAAQKQFDASKKELKNALDRFKKRGLRGKERDAARKTDIVPYEQARNTARDHLLAALKDAVPSPELALGQRPDCTIEEFRQHARSLRGESQLSTRATVDMLASFGAEVSGNPSERIEPTPFCFITGSGHQWFLDTARDLMARVSEKKLREALFVPWVYADEKLTMRWDPLDDRRYALMDRDPTASDNKSTTVWMANLLAYVALSHFPCVAVSRGAATACWALDKESSSFCWPVWQKPLGPDSIRSILTHRAFAAPDYESDRRELLTELRARGVAAVFSSRRIQVGNPPLHKINFTPAVGL